MVEEEHKLKTATTKAIKGLGQATPTLIGVILLISMAQALIPPSSYTNIFTNNYFTDTIIGTTIGSILAGNPITSYIIGGELLSQGVSLLAVTAFIIAWVTVGIIQLPAEILFLGKRFAIVRNITAFCCAILAAIITVMVVNLI